MTIYRVYSVDKAGKIIGAEKLIARSDREAFERAHASNRDTDCEVWNRTKLVGVSRRWVGSERYTD
jgi:hypothetical protein